MKTFLSCILCPTAKLEINYGGKNRRKHKGSLELPKERREEKDGQDEDAV